MQLVNKYNPLFTIILAIALSSSLPCINSCEAHDARPDICSSHFRNSSINELCNTTLGSENNTCLHDDLRCMGLFVNKKAINATNDLRAMANVTKSAQGDGGKNQDPAQSCAKHCNSAIGYLKMCNGFWKATDPWNTTNPRNTTTKWNRSNLQTYVSGAETYLDTCNDEYTDKPDNLTAASEYAMGLMNVELAIINKLDIVGKK